MDTKIREALLNAMVILAFTLLLLRALEPGTVQVPMPGDNGDDQQIVFPYA